MTECIALVQQRNVILVSGAVIGKVIAKPSFVAQLAFSMILIAQWSGGADAAAFRVGIFAILALACLGLWRLIRWLLEGAPSSEPWSEQISEEIAKDETAPLCHRCLAPHDPRLDFCPDCGAPVGSYTNLLPYPYLFSLGDTLRLGTTGQFRRSPLTITGFLALSLAQPIYAPVYWFMFLKKLFQAPVPSAEQPQLIPPTPDSQA